MPKASVKFDDKFLAYSGRQGAKGVFKGAVARDKIAAIHVFDTHSDAHPLWHIHILTARSETQKPTIKLTVSKTTADAVLAWFYERPFPPPEIMDIDDEAAYETAMKAFAEESK